MGFTLLWWFDFRRKPGFSIALDASNNDACFKSDTKLEFIFDG